MLRRFMFLIAMLCASSAFGATGNLSFTRPATYADGSPLLAADIDGYEMRCATFNGGVCSIPVVPLAGTFTSGTVTVAVPTSGGTACFNVFSQVNGLFSVASNQSCKVFPAVPPGPPTNVTIAVVIGVPVAPAYTYTSNNIRGVNVAGFVNLGRPCLGGVVFNYRGKPYRRVAREDVQWWSTTPQTRVAAPCGLGQVIAV